MVKPNAIVIESGSLLKKKGDEYFMPVEVLDWFKIHQQIYHLTLYIGGGDDTNEAFKLAKFKIEFCPLGRVTHNLAERELSEKVLRTDQAIVQDLFDREGITVQVKIPIDLTDDVINPNNGDLLMFSKYLGNDKIFRLTTKDRVKAKRKLIRDVARAFAPLAGKNGVDMQLSKIEVVGF